MDETRPADRMILAIVESDRANGVQSALLEKEFRVTRINTSGGFLRKGNVTFLVGVSTERVDMAVDIIRSQARPAGGPSEKSDPSVGTMLFVLPIARFLRI